MEIQLRPTRARIHPLVMPTSRRKLRGIGYTQPLDCTPTVPGAIPNALCIEENARIQQANMAEHDEGQRQTFLANCNRDWALNDQQFAALGLPRPANQCDAIYPADLRGAANPVQLAPVYMAPPPPPAPAPAPVAVSAKPPVTETYVAPPPPPAPAPAPAPAAASSDWMQAVSKEVQVGSESFPLWLIVLAVGGTLYFMTRGK